MPKVLKLIKADKNEVKQLMNMQSCISDENITVDKTNG